MSTTDMFYFDSASGGNSEDDIEDNLPYPEALIRSDFLSSDFDAPTYLSSLSDRHQTLEDLQSDLRERSLFLSNELLDLVNANYEEFLSLGTDLKGGEERIDDVRLGLLGFKSGVIDVRGKVKSRREEVEGLIKEKKDVRRQISLGRKLLEVNTRLDELEDRLLVISLDQSTIGATKTSTSSYIQENPEDKNFIGSQFCGLTPENLDRLAKDFLLIEGLITNIGIEHPFIHAQQYRMTNIKNAIIINLSNFLKEIQALREEENSEIVKILSIYRELGAADRALQILKEIKWKR